MGVEIISTGGTYKLLKENGIAVKEVEEVTGFPEMLDGRVKTLHPMIHAGILARRDVKEHMDAIAAKGIKPIDMVVVNLYPFKQTVLKDGVTFDEIVENIDIGGPSMIRAAAKNYKSVAVVTEPAQYAEIVAELKEKGEVSEELHGKLMAEAFVNTANYDSMIASQMYKRFCTGFPESFPIPLEKVETSGTARTPTRRPPSTRIPSHPAPRLPGRSISSTASSCPTTTSWIWTRQWTSAWTSRGPQPSS